MNRKTAPEEQETLTPGGIAVPPPLRIESAAFTGSLATLFHLARDGRIDLTGVPLSPVCSAYLEYIRTTEQLDVDAAGAALLALAYLVERKAWALLPIADPPPPQELPELPEPTAHEFAFAVDTLDEWQRERGDIFFRAAEADGVYELPFDVGKVTAADLARAFERIMERARPVDVTPLAKPRPSLQEVMASVLAIARTTSEALPLEAFLPEDYTRLDAVFVFLAVLELLRIGTLTAELVEGDVRFGLKGGQR